MIALVEEKTLKQKAETRYRRQPRGGAFASDTTDYGNPPSALEKRCERSQGHVLVFRKGKIVCTNCPAEWEDYGC